MKTLQVRLTFTEEILGTLPGNPELMEGHIATRSGVKPTEEEMAALRRAVENGEIDDELRLKTTFFARSCEAPTSSEKNRPVLIDYQPKGFFKGACSALRRCAGTRSEKLDAYKKVIDGSIFVMPKLIPLVLPEGTKLSICERPLRGQTPKGERIALARSEAAPAGTIAEMEIVLLNEKSEKVLIEWLDYGRWSGVGQWRGSGKGRFSYEIIGEGERIKGRKGKVAAQPERLRAVPA